MSTMESSRRHRLGVATLRVLCVAAILSGVALIGGWQIHGNRTGEILAGIGAIGAGIGLLRFSLRTPVITDQR